MGYLNVDRRFEIDSNLKRKITRLWNKNFELDIKPLKQYVLHTDQFVTKKLSKKATAVYIKSGFSFLPNTGKVLIPKKGFDEVTIKSGEIIYKKGKKTEHVYLGGDYEKLLKKAQSLQKGLGRNQLLSFKVGENAASNTRYLSLADMNDYLKHVLYPRMGKMTPAKFAQISIVTVDGDMPAWMKPKKAKSKKQSQNGKRK